MYVCMYVRVAVYDKIESSKVSFRFGTEPAVKAIDEDVGDEELSC